MATLADISFWFDRAVALKYEYLVIKCDTFDYTHYPVMCKTYEIAQAIVRNPGDMQRIMEVYNLSEPKEPQLCERRTWRL